MIEIVVAQIGLSNHNLGNFVLMPHGGSVGRFFGHGTATALPN
jgi:hypothetical protein